MQLALVVAAPDAPRLLSLLLLNRPTPAADLAPPYTGRRLVYGGYALKTALIGWFKLSRPAPEQLPLEGTLSGQPVPFSSSFARTRR